MRVVLIDVPDNPLVLLARATLVSYWGDWSVDRLGDVGRVDAVLHVPRVLGYGHESVLEHVKVSWAVEGCSRVCSHQLVRHRLASYTQRSQRYIREDGFGVVVPESVRRVGGSDVESFLELARDLYLRLVEGGVPAEDARYLLPQGVETKLVVSMNLREFKHFAGLRMCSRAQWEIRELAWKMWRSLWDLGDDWKKLLVWARIGPRCIQLGYCPERELMPAGCWKKMKDWWKEVESEAEKTEQ